MSEGSVTTEIQTSPTEELPNTPNSPEFPHSQTLEFQHGTLIYKTITGLQAQGGIMFDGKTGKPLYPGLLTSKEGQTILPPGNSKTPIEYAENVRTLIAESANNRNAPAAGELMKIKMQMTGFGNAALKTGDIETALLAFETAGALRNPTIKQAIQLGIEQQTKTEKVSRILQTFRQLVQTVPDFFNSQQRHAYAFVNGGEPPKYQPNDPKAQELIRLYNEDEKYYYLNGLLQQLDNIEITGTSGWTSIESKHTKLNWEKSRSSKLPPRLPDGGRIYLNASPQQSDRVFYELAKALNANPDVPADAKVLTHGEMDYENLNRADRMVLYFDAKHQGKILEILHQVYQKCGFQAFEDTTPVFAAKLKDAGGQVMKGVSFGQEPSVHMEGYYTFNNLRSGILEELKDQLNQPDFEQKFKAMLIDFKIDPADPAFNQGGKTLFPVIASNTQN